MSPVFAVITPMEVPFSPNARITQARTIWRFPDIYRFSHEIDRGLYHAPVIRTYLRPAKSADNPKESPSTVYVWYEVWSR